MSVFRITNIDPTRMFFNQSWTMEAANFFAIYVLFFGDFRCFRQVYPGESFDILQDWGRDDQIMLDFLSLMASQCKRSSTSRKNNWTRTHMCSYISRDNDILEIGCHNLFSFESANDESPKKCSSSIGSKIGSLYIWHGLVCNCCSVTLISWGRKKTHVKC